MMVSKLIVVLVAAVFLLFGCGEQNKKPQYDVTEPVVEEMA